MLKATEEVLRLLKSKKLTQDQACWVLNAVTSVIRAIEVKEWGEPVE